MLPPASHNDVFFDIEGLPLAEGGLEYLLVATRYAKRSASFLPI